MFRPPLCTYRHKRIDLKLHNEEHPHWRINKGISNPHSNILKYNEPKLISRNFALEKQLLFVSYIWDFPTVLLLLKDYPNSNLIEDSNINLSFSHLPTQLLWSWNFCGIHSISSFMFSKFSIAAFKNIIEFLRIILIDRITFFIFETVNNNSDFYSLQQF
jgi:hypothetical protein